MLVLYHCGIIKIRTNPLCAVWVIGYVIGGMVCGMCAVDWNLFGLTVRNWLGTGRGIYKI